MTTKQSQQLVRNPNTKKAIALLQKFAELETQYKAMEKEAKDARSFITEAMVEAGVPKIEDIELPGFTGFITLAERTNYRAEDIEQVPDEFIKPALDTTKVKAHATLTGQLPDGVSESKTQYIIPKFKEIK